MSSETVLITGCSDGGIGSALAIIFQERGFHVFATARDITKMSNLKDLPNITLLALDVTNGDTIKTAAASVAEKTGGTLDYLVNNAGHNHFMPILDENIEVTKELFDINVWGPLAVTQAFSPLIIQAKGSFVFVTSIAGYGNTPWMGTYSASKRSIEIIADHLRLEMKPFGVNITMVVTGAVVSNGQTYFGDFVLPENSLYKRIEDTIAARARGDDGHSRMPTMNYAAAVVDETTKRTGGKIWHGDYAEMVKSVNSPTVPQEVLVGLC
ncbi:putative hydroxybutyrate dehydrogenase [Lophiostoma macrostomum CBS 122681]|uniref:Putative hydroxybutyrate dehydrogenase n=1 Tax=Lophiostoma macrostomum CBS 122681 TaxID=1314788 RepID=A0A6A6TQG0_9PLEO|nr:putative hydroxybutyrate dehydrogenase [Lophiostoma macrostomum CBS 122681]